MKSPSVLHKPWRAQAKEEDVDNSDLPGEVVKEDGYEVFSNDEADDADSSLDLESVFRQIDNLSEDDVEKYASYLREEAYTDFGCLREAMRHPKEWAQIKLPLR